MTTINRQHRTALVIDTSKGVDSEFEERYNRLLQSVNGSNIKVDIYTFDGEALRPGTPEVAQTPAASEDVEAQLAAAGYKQVLVSRKGA